MAAGWALDLFRGRRTRDHGDIEIAVPAAGFPGHPWLSALSAGHDLGCSWALGSSGAASTLSHRVGNVP